MARWRLNQRTFESEYNTDPRPWSVTDGHFLVFFRDYVAARDYTIYQNGKEE